MACRSLIFVVHPQIGVQFAKYGRQAQGNRRRPRSPVGRSRSPFRGEDRFSRRSPPRRSPRAESDARRRSSTRDRTPDRRDRSPDRKRLRSDDMNGDHKRFPDNGPRYRGYDRPDYRRGSDYPPARKFDTRDHTPPGRSPDTRHDLSDVKRERTSEPQAERSDVKRERDLDPRDERPDNKREFDHRGTVERDDDRKLSNRSTSPGDRDSRRDFSTAAEPKDSFQTREDAPSHMVGQPWSASPANARGEEDGEYRRKYSR